MGDASSEQPGRSPRGSSGLRGERPTRSPGEGWNQGLQSPHLWPFTLSSASPALLTPIKGPTLHHKVQRRTEGLYLLGQPVPAETEPSLSSRGLEAKPLPFRNLPRVLVSRMGKMPCRHRLLSLGVTGSGLSDCFGQEAAELGRAPHKEPLHGLSTGHRVPFIDRD